MTAFKAVDLAGCAVNFECYIVADGAWGDVVVKALRY
jgi:hypothetical protein